MTFNFASLNEAIHDAKHYGYDFSNGYSFNFKTFVEKRHARIKTLNGIYETNWDKDGIDLLKGQATFVSPHEIEVKPKEGEAYRITAPHITIAVGGYPTKPEKIKGSEYGITSDDFFSMEYLPKKYAIVGAGYIAVELAGMLNAMGVETHLFIRGKEVLRKFDPMVSEAVTKYYEDQGVHIHKEHSGIKEVVQLKAGKDETDPREKELKLIMKDGSEMVVNELMWAIGRSPQLEHLGIDKTGLKQGPKSHIIVDKYQNTNVEGIYAIGDVTGQAELTPVAIAAGRRLSNRLFGPPEHKDDHLEYDRIPTVVFAHPPVATVGLTEPEAEEKFGKEDLKIYTTKFAPMYYDPFPPEEKKKHPTLYKIICQGKDEVIVGAHLIGDVAEASQLLGVIVRNVSLLIPHSLLNASTTNCYPQGLTKKALDDTVAVHPISMEELVTLR